VLAARCEAFSTAGRSRIDYAVTVTWRTRRLRGSSARHGLVARISLLLAACLLLWAKSVPGLLPAARFTRRFRHAIRSGLPRHSRRGEVMLAW
jgi:hypothetical protein